MRKDSVNGYKSRIKSALMSANHCDKVVWNWDTNTNSMANCLKHAVLNYEFIICHPGYNDALPFPYIKATQYSQLPLQRTL